MPNAQEFLARLDEKLAQHGMTDHELSQAAAGKPDVVRDIRRKGSIPGADRLAKIAKVLGTTSDWLLNGGLEPDAPPAADPGASIIRSPFEAFRGHDRPRDVPVLGTPSCGDYVTNVDGEEVHIETIDMDLDEVIDYVRRPVGIEGRKDVYAIYPQGFSMAPRFEPGELQYVDGRRAPSIGDYVVVQLRRPDPVSGERIVSALLKRLVRQGSDWVELQQFNPDMTFRVERSRIARIHRIMTLAELAGF